MEDWISLHKTISNALRMQGIWDEILGVSGLVWEQAKSTFIVPVMKFMVIVFVTCEVLLFVDRVYLAIALLFVKLTRLKPKKIYKWEAIKKDVELAGNYPMVLVQIPMYNEKEVYSLSIGAVCSLSWPADRIIVQVLDDSTDPIIKEMVGEECRKWANRGINIKHELRGHRKGYKAGALKQGMKHSYVTPCEYVAIFDADFQPDPDFLLQTIPFLLHNSDIALVQARWDFAPFPSSMERLKSLHMLTLSNNHLQVIFPSTFLDSQQVHSWTINDKMCGPPLVSCSESMRQGKKLFSSGEVTGIVVAFVFTSIVICMGSLYLLPRMWCRWKQASISSSDGVNSKESVLTRMQEMSLRYLFMVDQEIGSALFAFFGFNGTAGVWRISALNEAGGWKDRTTVEDMDLAVRASIKGWKFVYVDDVKVKSELPNTFNAYRNQQHRWSCGPANLFKKMALQIATNKDLSLGRKFYLIYSFFFVRKILAQIVPFTLCCVILPTTIFVPEVQVPAWGSFYLPFIITLLTVFSSPRSLHLLVLWIPFELAMSLHRVKATFIGLLGIGPINEWVVTEKLGDTLNSEKLGDVLNSKKIRYVITTEKFGDDRDTSYLPEFPKKSCFSIGERIHFFELFVGLYLCICACYDIYSRNLKDLYFVYLFLQSTVFFIAGFGYIGTFVPKS